MLKHKESLTQSIPEMSEEATESVRQKFRDIFRPKFRKGPWTCYGTFRQMEQDVSTCGNPGFSACYENSRREFGRSGLVRERLLRFMSDNYPGFGSDPILWKMREVRPGEVVTEYMDYRFIPEIKQSLADKFAMEYIRENGGICNATVCGVLEPLKCR